MYLSYELYQEMGGLLPKTEFSRHLVVAEAQVDAATSNRVRRDWLTAADAEELPYIGKLRALVFELTALANLAVNRQVVSENSDGLSLTFAQSGAEDYALKRSGFITDMLRNEADMDGVPLLYAGVGD